MRAMQQPTAENQGIAGSQYGMHARRSRMSLAQRRINELVGRQQHRLLNGQPLERRSPVPAVHQRQPQRAHRPRPGRLNRCAEEVVTQGAVLVPTVWVFARWPACDRVLHPQPRVVTKKRPTRNRTRAQRQRAQRRIEVVQPTRAQCQQPQRPAGRLAVRISGRRRRQGSPGGACPSLDTSGRDGAAHRPR